MMASSPICLLSKASKTKSWLWHHRLSHLNFGAINHIAIHGLVRGLPKLKFEKDHLCSACALGKTSKKPHKPKSEDTNQENLYLLHMDLCGPMRVASVNGKKYILMIQVWLKETVRRIRTDNGIGFVNQTLHEYYEKVGISHETSVARSPQQNDVVERRNHTLIEAARTMLIYAKAPLFLWAESGCLQHLIMTLKLYIWGNDPYFGIPIPEVTSDQSSSSDVIHTIVPPDHQACLVARWFIFKKQGNSILKSPLALVARIRGYMNFLAFGYSYETWSSINWYVLTAFEWISGSYFGSSIEKARILLLDVDDGKISFFFRDYRFIKIDTPIVVGKSKLDRIKKGKHVDPSHYGEMIGTLIYLTDSRKSAAISSTKAEYISLSGCYAQVLWVRSQLTDYGFGFNKIPMYCDNKSAIALCCNNVQHSRSKHIDIRFHFIKEHVENGVIEIYFVNIEYQLADIFTKALGQERIEFLINKLGMRSFTPKTLKKLADDVDE
ncbi:retrovirus-related pol polyprotein from transposon TNT 1-94 [Tanacetum coccineum]